MTLEAVVGVDIGTTETKALVVGTDGRELGFARGKTTWAGVETTAEALLADVLAAITAALADAGNVQVVGLGLAGFAESGVVLDGAGRVITPVIAWYDQRGATELAALDAAFRTEFPRRTGLPVGPQWTLGKLLWLRENGLDLPGGACWLNIPEYIAHALGADRVSEPSLASRTGLLDQATGHQWSEALGLLGAESLLPDTLTAGQPAGVVTAPGVPDAVAGAVITVVGHDHPVAATGVGATGDHELFNSCGTADVLLRTVPRRLTDDERDTLVAQGIDAGSHVLNGQSVLIGGVRAGLVLRRVLAMLGADDPAGRARLDQPVAGTRRTAVSVTGARSTDEDVTVTVTDGASPTAVWAGALDHISDVTETLLHGMNDVVGPHHAAVAAGGWTRMVTVRAAKSRLLPGLRFSSLAQPGAFGAALFAAWAAAGNPGDFLTFAGPLRRTALESPTTTPAVASKE